MIFGWLLVTILAYLFFGLASLYDKLVLTGTGRRLPQPSSYTFYVGVFSLFVIFLIPFAKNFSFPNAEGLFWILIDAVVHIIGLYAMFKALEKFDVSKVVTTIGATQPLFVLLLTWIAWGTQAMSSSDILAFIILFVGSIIISVEKNIELTGSYLKITGLSSLMFSLDYIFSKFIFINQPFLQGIIWMRLSVFLLALLFLLTRKGREEIFSKKLITDKKTQIFFLTGQICGGTANFLQSLAIALAPVAFLAIVNSLRGIQYVFLFVATLGLSVFYPKILKEELSLKIVFQKVVSVILIATGLALLVS